MDRIAPLMVTYHYVKIYVSIIIQLEIININVRNFKFPIGFSSNPHPFWTPFTTNLIKSPKQSLEDLLFLLRFLLLSLPKNVWRLIVFAPFLIIIILILILILIILLNKLCLGDLISLRDVTTKDDLNEMTKDLVKTSEYCRWYCEKAHLQVWVLVRKKDEWKN
jgi:hypothetical protein